MRKPIIAGNWKMNKTPAEAAALVPGQVFMVNVTENDSNYPEITYHTDKTSDEIYKAWKDKTPIMCRFNKGGLPLMLSPFFAGNELACFSQYGLVGEILLGYMVIIQGSTVMAAEYQPAMSGEIPTLISQLTNDSGFQTAQQVTAIVNQQLGVIENGTY